MTTAPASRTALAVCFGILLALGLLTVAGGVFLLATSNDPRVDARASLKDRNTVGEYVSPEETRDTLSEGDMVARTKKREGVETVAVGAALCLPFLALLLRPRRA